MKPEEPLILCENTILKLVDYVLLNSCSASSLGLYDGKSGIALTLFEVSRYLQDEYIEELSLMLLQESLLIKSDDISFSNGRSGVGFSLMYLIQHSFVKADFFELFQDNLNRIILKLEQWEAQDKIVYLVENMEIVNLLDCIPICISFDRDKRDYFIRLLFSATQDFLIDQFNKIHFYSNEYLISNVMNYYSRYLKLINNISKYKPPYSLLINYAKLYHQNRLVSDFSIGHHLNFIIPKAGNNEAIKAVAHDNMKYAALNIHLDSITLSEKINLLYLFSFYKNIYNKQILLLERALFCFKNEEAFENNLFKDIPSIHPIDSYQFGIPRLLLYWIYSNNMQNINTYDRFKLLF